MLDRFFWVECPATIKNSIGDNLSWADSHLQQNLGRLYAPSSNAAAMKASP
jgi:hypothetical protein